MKKVLIVARHLQIGGIQKSLIELLKLLSGDPGYEITLFCCSKKGPFLEGIPSDIHILEENPYAAICEMGFEDCKKMGVGYGLLRLILSLWTKIFGKKLPAKLISCLAGKIAGEYDVAISYAQPADDKVFCGLTNEFVLNCTYSKMKIGFVHCDFGNYGGNTPANREMYKSFDRIAAVSRSVGKAFSDIIPEVRDRVYTVYNTCDANEIKKLSLIDTVKYSDDMPTIITVARLSEEKGHLRSIPVFARLKAEGIPFKWHIVGGGEKYEDLMSAVKKYNLTKNIVFEGEQTNPYRYMKDADFLFLPSLHEAAPMVFGEAEALGITVLTTETLSARELISERNLGIVCENNDNAIYDMLKTALTGEIHKQDKSEHNFEARKKQFEKLCS